MPPLLAGEIRAPGSASDWINKKQNAQIDVRNLLAAVMFVALLKNNRDFPPNFCFILSFSKFSQGKETQTADPS